MLGSFTRSQGGLQRGCVPDLVSLSRNEVGFHPGMGSEWLTQIVMKPTSNKVKRSEMGSKLA